MRYTFRLVLLFFFFVANSAPAQITSDILRKFINDGKHLDRLNLSDKKGVQQFYASMNYSPAWVFREENTKTLILILRTAERRGLLEQDYQYNFVNTLSAYPSVMWSAEDSILADIKFSDAAIHFFSDIVYGNTKPALGYYGIDYIPDCYSIPSMVADYCKKNQLYELLTFLEFSLPEVKIIGQKIAGIKEILKNEDYKEEKITSAVANIKNNPLLKKLYFLGITDSVNITADTVLKRKMKEAQRQFNLLADGVLRKTFLEELNVPLSARVHQLELSVNYYRWLSCLSKRQPVVVVNIPAAYLKVYHNDTVVIEMRMIVGKPSTPTPTFSSTINEVILYPYWVVPHSIIAKEWLPAVKRNIGYIEANNFQVINSQGKIIDPYKVDWQSLNASTFPYIIRQSTGCDNALGLIKLNFYSPFGVYLHDTPDKSLFMLNKRYFSHGCMRMENPLQLGHLILKNNPIAIDTLEEKGCLLNQFPVPVPADVQMPVIVWYNPAGVDSTGRVIYYEDVYKKLKWIK